MNRGARLIAGGDGVLERLLGGDLLRGQALLALVVLLGLDQRRPGLRRLRVGAGERRLVGPRIDAEQDLADIDDGALLVLALEQDAAHLGADLDDAEAGDAAGEFEGQRHVGGLELDDADLRRRRRRGRRRGLGPVPPEDRTNHDRDDDGDRNDAPRPTRYH